MARRLRQTGFELRCRRALGRRFRLGHWVDKLSQYNPAIYRAANAICAGLRLRGVPVHVNLFDQMVCLAA
jgi:hypothetical protein